MSRTAELAIVEEVLQEVLESLREMPPSPRAREFRVKASSYERVIRGWAFSPPAQAQYAAMLECMMELLHKVAATQTSTPRAGIRHSQRPTKRP